MTLEEYVKEMETRLANIDRDSDEEWDELYEFQFTYMRGVLEEYRKTVGNNEAKRVCCSILDYIINQSESGSVNMAVETEEFANEVREMALEDFAEYMLDAPEVYFEEAFDEWMVSCMFGGYFVPCWDGFRKGD